MSAHPGPNQEGCGYKCLEGVEVNSGTYMTAFSTHLLPAIRPSWKGKELDSKVFAGLTNFLVAIFDKKKGLEESREDVVLVRMNGSGSERFINRTDEIECLATLSTVGLCPSIYARFGNGLCYGYFPGRQLHMKEVGEEVMSGKIARLLARLHCVKLPQHFQGRPPELWIRNSSWIAQLPRKLEDPVKQKSFEDHFRSVEALDQEGSWIQKLISTSCNSPVVFCHNDANIPNFIYDDVTGNVRLVDFEYGGPNYLAFDIANHFTEFTGIEEVNFDLYPDEAFQKRWLQTYLQERARLIGEPVEGVSQDDVLKLYQEVEIFAMAAHLHWVIWCLLQSAYSVIDFDYMQLAAERYGEYLKMKNSH